MTVFALSGRILTCNVSFKYVQSPAFYFLLCFANLFHLVRIFQTTMKQSATVAAIFLVYAMITLRYGLLLFQYVSQYKIEYV